MCLQILSSFLYKFEKISFCLACVCLWACLVSTLIFTLGFGIGLGYNYCFVDLKTHKFTNQRGSLPKTNNLRTDNDKLIYPYPQRRYIPRRTSTTSSSQVQAPIIVLRIGEKDLIGGYKSYDQSLNENITLYKKPSTVEDKLNAATRTSGTSCGPLESEPDVKIKYLLNSTSTPKVQPKRTEKGHGMGEIFFDRGPSTVHDGMKHISIPLRIPDVKIKYKIMNSETSTPNIQPERTEKGHGMGEVFFDYNANDDISNAVTAEPRRTLKRHLKISKYKDFNRPSRLDKTISERPTQPDHVPIYAPNYKLYYVKTGDNENKTAYYIVPDALVKANAKIGVNKDKDLSVIPVSKSDVLRLLSKRSGDN